MIDQDDVDHGVCIAPGPFLAKQYSNNGCYLHEDETLEVDCMHRL